MSNAVGTSKTLRRKSQGWDANTGTYEQFEWAGTKSAILGMISGVKAVAQSYEYDHDGATYRLSYRISNDPKNQEVQDEVRMDVHRVHKSIFEPPTGGLTADQLRSVQEYAEDKTKTELPNDWVDAQLELYDLAIQGVTSWIVYQPVIIRTSTAGPKYGFVPDYSLVGSIIHPSSIQTAVKAKLPIAPPNDTYDGGGFVYGWLQHMPSYALVAGNKAQFQVEWEYGLWSTFLYGNAVTL
jgi:hypothetical protein